MKKIVISLIILLVILFGIWIFARLSSYDLIIDGKHDFLVEQPEKRYKSGDNVVLKTGIFYDVGLECFINGKSIGMGEPVETNGKYTHWEYYFKMPNESVTVTFKFIGSKGNVCISNEFIERLSI